MTAPDLSVQERAHIDRIEQAPDALAEGMTYLPICGPCVRGEGSECHTPECALFLRDVPPDGLIAEFALDVERREAEAAERARAFEVDSAGLRSVCRALVDVGVPDTMSATEGVYWLAEQIAAPETEGDPYDKPVRIQGHMHSEPVCAWPDCETYLTREQMAALQRETGGDDA